MNQERDNISIEVLPPERSQLGEANSHSLVRGVRDFLLTVPTPVPILPPVILREDCEEGFIQRLGTAIIFSFHGFQYYLSPSGSFGVLAKLFVRWFVFLIALIVLLGIPALIAAQFLSSISALLYTAALNFFWTVCYFVGGCVVLAVAITLLLFLRAKAQENRRYR